MLKLRTGYPIPESVMIALMVLTIKSAPFYRIKILEVAAALCLMLCWPTAFSIEVEGLYQATIIVESRNSEQERRRAFNAAMREVLAKVSGLSETTNFASIRRALNNPEPFVESWRTKASLLSLNPEIQTSEMHELIEIEVNFYASEVQRLLSENNISIWPVNRPETLVWLIVEDELNVSQVPSSDSREQSDRIKSLKKSANMRGLPLLFPLLDLEDQLRLNVNKIGGLDEAVILNASERYQAESILALRIYRSLSEEVLTESLYFFRGNVFSNKESELSEEDFINSSINLAANELSQYYAVLTSEVENSVRINLQVDGINSPEKYAGLLNYLNTLEGVRSFKLTRAASSILSIQLETGGQLRQLLEAIALEPSLQKVTELSRTGDDFSMRYLWIKNQPIH